MFQRIINKIFQEYIVEEWLFIYMDDILIRAYNEEDLKQKTEKVLEMLLKYDLYCKQEKCQFGIKRDIYLGMIIEHNKIKMNPIKLRGITNWKAPEKVKEVRGFLEFCNFYRQFIPNFAKVSQPLTNLTKKDLPWNWTKECRDAFKQLKSEFLKASILQMPDNTKQCQIDCDASLFATAAVLKQQNDNGEWMPCGYVSYTFSSQEHNYEIYERKLLAILHALRE